MSTIFLDRDGVINENQPDYVKSCSEFRFLPGSLEAIAKLTQAGHRIVVCTNQAGIARGSFTVEAVEEIHRNMIAAIAEAGGVIEKVYYCPHGKDENCPCRKPRPGMLLRARDELGLDMSDAVFGQPVTQRFKIVSHRLDGADQLLRPLARLVDQDTRHHAGLVHIQTGTALDHSLHGCLHVHTRPRRRR